jgi:DNA polymerase-3 subunit gamma/tau
MSPLRPPVPAHRPESAFSMDLFAGSDQPYRVLARTYRPQKLSELIGQDALVRTLTNAMASGRVAHAFLLSGIRGVGKTTTARIIARGLNCTGPDGQGGPTPEPCGECSSCRSLVEERPLDVIEMDAATRTGIDDIREIVDAVRYAPTASRYKIYIIDEIHMLSEKAFNGLLKTLEEPPPHAKFIFATTEVRKLPVTVLSRCQRFDLKRVETPVLEAHLARITEAERIEVAGDALRLVARAAEGSVRDALSLLDQAIVLGQGTVDAATVAGMLGLGDRELVLDLFERVMGGDAAGALDSFRELFALGAEPAAVLEDLLEIAHWVSCLEVDRDATSIFAGTPEPMAAGRRLAERLDLAVLARAWQVLLKGLDEVRGAPHAAAAAEMVLLRLAAMGRLPTPGELARRLDGAEIADDRKPAASSPPAAPRSPLPTPPLARVAPLQPSPPDQRRNPARASPPAGRRPEQSDRGASEPVDFADLVRLLNRHGERLLAAALHQGAHLVAFQKDRLELRLDPHLPGDLVGRLSEALLRLTGRRWLIALSQSAGAASLADQAVANRERLIRELAEHEAVREVLDAFPGARIIDIRDRIPADDRTDAPATGDEARYEDNEHEVDHRPLDDDEADEDGASGHDDSRMER